MIRVLNVPVMQTQYASVYIRNYVVPWLVLDRLSRLCINVQNG